MINMFANMYFVEPLSCLPLRKSRGNEVKSKQNFVHIFFRASGCKYKEMMIYDVTGNRVLLISFDISSGTRGKYLCPYILSDLHFFFDVLIFYIAFYNDYSCQWNISYRILCDKENKIVFH